MEDGATLGRSATALDRGSKSLGHYGESICQFGRIKNMILFAGVAVEGCFRLSSTQYKPRTELKWYITRTSASNSTAMRCVGGRVTIRGEGLRFEAFGNGNILLVEALQSLVFEAQQQR